MPTSPTPLNFVGKTARLFLENRTVSALTIGVLMLWGILSFVLMPKQYNPEIVAPAFTVSTEFPHTSAEEIRSFLTRPIEDGIASLPKVDAITSQSIAGGRSIVMVKFLVGSSQDNAVTSLNQKLRDIQPTLPTTASEPLVRSIDPDTVPIIDIGLTSPTRSEGSLRELAIAVTDELKLVPGISSAEMVGGRTNHLQIELDGTALIARNITIPEITTAIARANGAFSIDTLQATSTNPIISLTGNINGIEDASHIILRENGSTLLRLGDIARISYDHGYSTSFVRLTEKDQTTTPVVHIALAKLKGENATTVSKQTLAALETLRGRMIPDDVTVSVLRDEGQTASEEISKLSFDLVKSILIVSVLLAIFLGVRNALVASISIPLVLLAVFSVGLLAGQTVNRITLFALILSLGLLVDDAIVVVENIARYFRLYPDEKRLPLIVRAVNEVGGALALSTLTMALAFIPMAFVTGMMGPYMGPIPFFVPAALIISLIISVTLNPYLAYLLTPRHESKNNQKKNIFVRALEKIERSYERTLSTLLSDATKRKQTLIVTALLLFGAFILPFTPLVPFRMLPKADKESFSVYLDLPDNTNVTATDTVATTFEKMILTDHEVVGVESFIGIAPVVDFNGLFRGSSERVGENQATIKVNLTHLQDRSITSETIAFRTRDALERLQKTIPDATFRIVEDPPGPPVLSTFLLKIEGENDQVREHIARDFAEHSAATRGVVDIDTSIPERGIDSTYRIDTEKAQLLGVSPGDAESTLHTALSGSIVGLYRGTPVANTNQMKAEQEYIILRLAPGDRTAEQDLSFIRVPGKNGDLVPLTAFIEKTDQSVERTILTNEREKSTLISAEMGNRSIVYAVLDLFPKLLHYRLPSGTGEIVSWSPFGVVYQDRATGEHYKIMIDGEWKLSLEVFRDLGIVMGAVIFLIFFVLAARTASLIIPILIMVSIPLGLIGIFPGFALLQALKGTYFNATSMIGVIALSGLSVKNAIIYLEYLEPLKRAGRPIREALVETGRIRLLPITLTSLAAILGSLTIITDPVWEGLAWSIIFGLAASTLLTLIIFPLLYFLAKRNHWKN